MKESSVSTPSIRAAPLPTRPTIEQYSGRQGQMFLSRSHSPAFRNEPMAQLRTSTSTSRNSPKHPCKKTVQKKFSTKMEPVDFRRINLFLSHLRHGVGQSHARFC